MNRLAFIFVAIFYCRYKYSVLIHKFRGANVYANTGYAFVFRLLLFLSVIFLYFILNISKYELTNVRLLVEMRGIVIVPLFSIVKKFSKMDRLR